MDFSGISQPYDPPDYQRDQVLGNATLPESDVLTQDASDAFFGMEREAGAFIASKVASTPLAALRDADLGGGHPNGQADYIDAHTLNQDYGQSLGLSFSQPMRRAQADILVQQQRDKLHRDYVNSHAPGGFWNGTANFTTQLAVSAVDPANVAAAFVPVVGETRAGLWAQKIGTTAARVAEGGVEGAAGMAALQPVQAAYSNEFQQEYGPMDAFMNVAFGSVLGGGLHAGAGAISDMLGGLHPETREAALRGSVAQMAEGRPVDATAAIASDPTITSDPTFREATSAPVIDREGIDLAAREARAQSSISDLQGQLASLPEGDATASDALSRLRAVEQRLSETDLEPAERKSLLERRDELLTDTTPEALQAKAAPFEQRRNVQNQISASQREVENVRAQQNARAVDAAFERLSPQAQERLGRYGYKKAPEFDIGRRQEAPQGVPTSRAGSGLEPAGLGDGEGTGDAATGARSIPAESGTDPLASAASPDARLPRAATPEMAASQEFATNSLNRARTAQNDFTQNREPSTLVPPGVSEAAARDVASGKGDNIDEELAEAERTLADYQRNGVISDDDLAAMKEANAADSEMAKTQGDAAKAASTCLWLHP